MKFLILLSAVLALSELHTASAFFDPGTVTPYGCGDFLKSSGVSNYDKFCYSNHINWQIYCIGNQGLDSKVECTDTVVDTIHPAINLVFDEEKWMPMAFNKQDEGNCQNYHLDYLETLAWSLGYSNYTVNVKKSSSGCKFVALDTCGYMQTIMEGGKAAADIDAPYDVTFWGNLDAPTCEDGILNQCEDEIDCGGPCRSCGTCTDYLQNQGEDDIDCGGPCPPCPSCYDNIQNQGETDLDCGGPCGPCAPSCNDNIQNQGETYVDCGGPCGSCAPSCNDKIQNQGETDVDCGGPCSACPTCEDGIQNQGETGTDCGGPCAKKCQELGPCTDCTGCFSLGCDQYGAGLTPQDCVGIMTFECSGYYKCPSNCTGCGGFPDNSCYKYDDASSGHPIVNPTVCKSFGGRDCKAEEEVPKDVCRKYNGIPHKSKPVCCNKDCPKCGGARCGKSKNAYSGKLKSQCCAWKIKKRGQTCGSNGRKAPCNLPSNQ